MKSFLKNLSLLSMGLLIYSCNEKISAELQDGASTTVPPVQTPKEYYFKVTNNSPSILNYVLHRSGSGRYGTNNWDCEISSNNIPFSSTLYVGEVATAHQNKTYDISCFFDAEELSMAFNGLSFKMEASKNTCDYVAYAPYSYLDAIPGSTTASWRGITCGDGVSNADAQAFVSVTGWDQGLGAVRLIGCDEMVDTSISVPALRRIRGIPEVDSSLCRFDYASNGGGNGMNCDTGTMTYDLTNVYDSDSDPAVTLIDAKPVVRPDYKCGGKIVNCIGGAIKHVPTLANKAYGIEIIDTKLNTNVSVTYTLPKFLTRGASVDIANYRRGLAALDLAYNNYNSLNDSEWDGEKNYDPFLVEKFSMNQTPDSASIIDTAGTNPSAPVSNATWESKVIENGYTATPLAADPFLGLGSARVNPLYTFYCLDTALEIKARIRMAVRDWDRVFPSSTADLELISDLGKPLTSRRQDLPNDEEEIPNDPSPVNLYNDFSDWDAFVLMTRNDPNGVLVYDPGFTTWEPTAGWWSTSIFPSLGPVSATQE